MKKTVISGGKKLFGEVTVHSAKNSLLPILAATVLSNEDIYLENCPPLKDVLIMLELLESIGCRTEYENGNIHIDPSGIDNCRIDGGLMHKLRSSIFILGPLASRMKYAEMGYPGGCDIGIRPIDLHLKGLRDLGVKVEEKDGLIICNAENIRGGEVYLDYPSVGATENIMMASSLAEGATVISNAAKEPEIVDLQNFINLMGGRIKGAGTGRIVIHGRDKLGGCGYEPMPDRIVTGTYLIAAAMTQGEIYIKNGIKEHLSSLIGKLKDGGCKISYTDGGIELKSSERFKASSIIETLPYPGFPTDLQSPMMALESIADGTCVLIENVFENRFRMAGELKKMGADITVKDRSAFIRGKEKLRGTTVNAYDLRGSAALVLAGLCAEGITVVRDGGFISRGYYGFENQLKKLGADIAVIEE